MYMILYTILSYDFSLISFHIAINIIFLCFFKGSYWNDFPYIDILQENYKQRSDL